MALNGRGWGGEGEALQGWQGEVEACRGLGEAFEGRSGQRSETLVAYWGPWMLLYTLIHGF